MQKINYLINQIKAKKSLSNLDDKIIEEKISTYLKQNTKFKQFLEKSTLQSLQKSSKTKSIIKSIRSDLHKTYGVFQRKLNQRYELLEQLKKKYSLETLNKILNTHSSSAERLKIYPHLYQLIFKFTGKPKKILDLACGLNPLSIPYMNLKNIDYTATELSKEDCKLLKDFFKIRKIKGKAIQQDLTKVKTIKGKYDICFLFKVFDSIETKGHKLAEHLIKIIPSKYIIASFPTKTISYKAMNKPRRTWLETMLKRISLNFIIFELGNEIFYVIEKKK